MEFQSFIKSKFTTVLLGLALVFVMVLSARLYMQKYEVDKEIKKLQDQASKVEGQNNELSQLINYLNTPEYTERQAREKLNLKKEGEQVVVLPDSVTQEQNSNISSDDRSNPQKWYQYLFGENNGK